MVFHRPWMTWEEISREINKEIDRLHTDQQKTISFQYRGFNINITKVEDKINAHH